MTFACPVCCYTTWLPDGLTMALCAKCRFYNRQMVVMRVVPDFRFPPSVDLDAPWKRPMTREEMIRALELHLRLR